MYKPKTVSVGTHNGIFHLDELVAIALISILHDGNITVVRSRDNNVLNYCNILVDVGGGAFDHHMPGGNGKRDSGTPFASAGLVWKTFGTSILKKLSCPKEHINKCKVKVDESLIEDLDKIDNGINSHSPFEYISFYLPNWDKADTSDMCFMEALEVTCNILKKAIIKVIDEAKNEITLGICLAAGGVENIVEIPSQFIKWQEIMVSYNNTMTDKVDFVVFPYPAGGYAAQCIPPSMDEPFKQRIPFPKEWAGQTSELPKLSGVPTATFCHNACFFVRAKTREDVISLCKIATKHYK